ncbi:MAG: YidC/Oxa1 family membrane protein insertase [Clostridiales bacterium]|nr:YidC/Oxa1 family membrane protein insertase [Clostridiales bacterium]MDY6041188.1 YidC/Oxa1 family membrane protein insertase [Candidatus Faecousia sp.]
MFLAFHISDIITIPFGYLLDWLYQFTSNYGIALILFAILVKLILFPIQAKSKKSMMKMSRLSPLVQKIQARYPDDQQKQNEALQQLYKDEGVSMTGGCLWSFVPLLILLPLYQVVRQPIVYMLHESLDVAEQIIEIIKAANSEYFGGNPYYHQMVAARYLPEFAEAIKEAIPSVSANTLAGLNFDFLGIDLGAVPQFNVFRWTTWDWAHIGAFLIPILSAGSQVLSMFISQKMNDSVITNEKGVQDKETAKNSQQNQTNMIMMWMMPLMSLWIGFTVPAALSLYWFIQGIVSIVQDVFLTQHYRKIYDAEDAVRLQKAMEEERLEAERERVRAERRAANPDGQTQNTSKKKMQKQQQLAEEAAKAAAAREYAAKKGIVVDEEAAPACMSGIPERPFCKGRNYNPNRYRKHTEE